MMYLIQISETINSMVVQSVLKTLVALNTLANISTLNFYALIELI